eukprot:scaffold4066_cov417-Prasinococcus_capsulatus_cf.AAC.14
MPACPPVVETLPVRKVLPGASAFCTAWITSGRAGQRPALQYDDDVPRASVSKCERRDDAARWRQKEQIVHVI